MVDLPSLTGHPGKARHAGLLVLRQEDDRPWKFELAAEIPVVLLCAAVLHRGQVLHRFLRRGTGLAGGIQTGDRIDLVPTGWQPRNGAARGVDQSESDRLADKADEACD